ncbi:hypothetical protein [Dactylosporangium sp. NPDC049140]|jgi:hypothetical protein|uniref:hypothetical protein n=1 Tax=Dactylosporangium sp. NPDC049140 TaxID=3155647 RepID=UPI0033C3E6C1
MGFSLDVGLFLCTDPDGEEHWPLAAREAYLDTLNEALRGLGLAEHREPRALDEIDPGTDPCPLGESMGPYSSHARRADRLDWLARHVAVVGSAPAAEPPYEPGTYQAYDALPDRGAAFDHLLAACQQEVVVLPRRLERVLCADSPAGVLCFVSAHRLRAEAAALAFVLRYPDPSEPASPVVDPVTGDPIGDRSFAGLDTRVAEDAESWQRWADESVLCHRLLRCAADILRTGALGHTS